MMKMTATHMFGALAVSAAAAMLAACGQSPASPAPVDPARAPAAPLTVQTPVAAYAPVKAGEHLTAETFLNPDDSRSNYALSGPAASLEACKNIAQERTYVSNISKDRYPSYTRTSCLGEDGTARARFECARANNGLTTCKPF